MLLDLKLNKKCACLTLDQNTSTNVIHLDHFHTCPNLHVSILNSLIFASFFFLHYSWLLQE